MNGNMKRISPAHANLWRTMRMLKEFTIKELVSYADTPEVPTTEKKARSYVCELVRAGYIRIVCITNRQRLYKLDVYTGSLAPAVQMNRNIFDRNINIIATPQSLWQWKRKVLAGHPRKQNKGGEGDDKQRVSAIYNRY